MDLNEVMPWGLTLAQSLCLGVGGFMLIGAWVIVTSFLRLGKNIIMCGLVVIMGLMFCGTAAAALYELSKK